MTFQTAVQSYIGTFSDTASLSQWLTECAQMFISKLPDKVLRPYSSNYSVSSSGSSVIWKRVLEISYNYYISKEFPAGMKARLLDAHSIYYALSTSPAHYIDNGNLYIAVGGSNVNGIMLAVAYPTVSYADSSIVGLPIELNQAVILFAAIQGQIQNINNIHVSIDGLTFSFPTPPTTPSVPSFVYGAVNPTTIAETTIGNLGIAPSYNPPVLSLPSIPSAFSIVSIPPITPAIPSFSYTDAISGIITPTTIVALPALTPYTVSLNAAPLFVLSGIGTAPTPLSAPSFTYTPATAGIIANINTTDLSAKFAQLSTYLDTNNDFELAQGKIADIQASLNQFIQQANLSIQQAQVNAKLSTDTSVQNELELLQAQIQNYTSSIQQYGVTLDKYKTDITAKYQEYQLNLQSYVQGSQIALTNALNTFNSNVEVYRATIQENLAQAQLDQQRLVQSAQMATDIAEKNKLNEFNASVQLYEDTLKKYAEDLNLYQSTVASEVQVYTQNLRVWEVNVNSLLQKYSIDLQNNLNSFQALNVPYQANLQVVLSQAQLDQQRLIQIARNTDDVNLQNSAKTLETQIQQYLAILQKYQDDLGLYSSGVQTEISRVSTYINKFNSELNVMIQLQNSLQLQYDNYLKLYGVQ